MKKLNNKGMTIVEILVCFVLVALITVSVYSAISSFNNKRNIESYKEKIYTYKNTLTKLIQDDLVKNGLISAKYDPPSDLSNEIYTVTLGFRDGTSKKLIVTRQLARDYDESVAAKEDCGDSCTKVNDSFMINYDGIDYSIPDLGEYENEVGEVVKDLRINNIDIDASGNVLSIYIGFYHPDLSTRYAISIVCPINYY